jgi:AcrR family transcriptional regulator
VGRPPATDSAETRRRILAAARTCFSRDGYDKTTNKDIASVAGISAGALYHYFPSKCALFVASYQETLDMVFGAFDKALEGTTSLAGKIKVLMDVAADMHAQDRSLAGFVAIAPMESGGTRNFAHSWGRVRPRYTATFSSWSPTRPTISGPESIQRRSRISSSLWRPASPSSAPRHGRPRRTELP